MRFALCIAALSIFTTACNSVSFTPTEEAPQSSQEVVPPPAPPPPAPLCIEGQEVWSPGGIGETRCPAACSDGSYLQCQTTLENQTVCAHGQWVDTNVSRIASVGAPIGACPVPPPPPTMVTDTFNTPPQGKADILIVMDTTPSMYVNLDKLASRFKSLTKSLGDIDYQVAVTNAGVKTGWWGSWDAKGKFFTFDGDPKKRTILKSTDANVDDYFYNTVGHEDDQYITDEMGRHHPCDFAPFCMNPNPEPLAAIKKAIDLRGSSNAGFFRKDSWFVPIVISDADEDENGNSAATTPANLLAHYKSNLGTQMKGLVGFGIIVKPGDTACKNKEGMGGTYGTFADQLAKQTDGLTISICANDYSAGLNQISDRVREKLTSLTLSQDPTGTVTVTVTPAVAGLTWTRTGRVLRFSKPLPANAKVEVTYRVGN